jgi:adenine-specific DNA-methyltransferase
MKPIEPHRGIGEEKLAQLKEILPEVFRENKLDIEALETILGDAIEDDSSPERYQLSWAGKRKSMQAANLPYTGTLRYQKGKGIDEEKTGNIYIEGENLEVLRILQKSYQGKIKMIYIDPPYNTGNDFIYNDDFKVSPDTYLKQTGQMDESGALLTTNPKTSGRYHSNWLSMMYPRLRLARNLLRDDGVIFVSIDDNEVHNLRMIMNEIFGEENFVGNIIWEKRYGRSNNAKLMTTTTEHILLFRKTDELGNLREVRSDGVPDGYSNPDNDPRGVWTSVSFVNQVTKESRPNLSYTINNPNTGEKINHPTNAWKISKDNYNTLLKENRLYWGSDGKAKYPRIKRFLSELDEGMVPVNFWKIKEAGSVDMGTKEIKDVMNFDAFTFPKPTLLIQKMLSLFNPEEKNIGYNDIILDFFSGSGTTAHSVLDLNKEDGGNRKFICVQIPEPVPKGSEAEKAGYKSISDIGIARITKVIEKMKKEKSENPSLYEGKEMDLGFRVFSLGDTNLRKFKDLDTKDLGRFKAQLKDSLLPFKETADPMELVIELMLLEGYPLDARIEPLKIKGNTLYRVTRRETSETDEIYQLLIILDTFDKSHLEGLALNKKTTLICKDNLSPSLQMQLDEICNLRTY